MEKQVLERIKVSELQLLRLSKKKRLKVSGDSYKMRVKFCEQSDYHHDILQYLSFELEN